MLARIRQRLLDDDGAVTADWVLLTATLVGMGFSSAASVRSGVNALANDINAALSSASVANIAMLGSGSAQFQGDWNVAAVSNGMVGGYHPVPWTFTPNGTVFAGTIWSGTWTEQPDGSLAVSIRHNSGGTDSFTVAMNPDGSGFTAYQNGQVYRSAVRR